MQLPASGERRPPLGPLRITPQQGGSTAAPRPLPPPGVQSTAAQCCPLQLCRAGQVVLEPGLLMGLGLAPLPPARGPGEALGLPATPPPCPEPLRPCRWTGRRQRGPGLEAGAAALLGPPHPPWPLSSHSSEKPVPTPPRTPPGHGDPGRLPSPAGTPAHGSLLVLACLGQGAATPTRPRSQG